MMHRGDLHAVLVDAIRAIKAFNRALADAEGVTAYLAREWEQGPAGHGTL